MVQKEYNKDIDIFRKGGCHGKHKKSKNWFKLYRKFNKGQLILEVDFQRSSVWKEKQKCELIESILMGLPLPIFYLKQMDNATYVIVDGKQRLSTLFDFIDNKFVLKSLKILKFLVYKITDIYF